MRIERNGYIEKDGEVYVTLPEGDYDFTVTKVDFVDFPGSDKLDPCEKAVVEMSVVAPKLGKTTVTENIFLDDAVEWKISSFFRCIGQKKHGQRIQMDWDKVVGSKGRAHLVVNSWESNDGTVKTNNKVKNFIDPETELGGEEEW